MSLKILIAGCSKDEKDGIESSVKTAFVGRPGEEAWNVSLVKIANQWSVEIDGPDPVFKGLSLVAPTEDLTGSLKKVLGDAVNGGGTGAPQAGPSGSSSQPGPDPPSAEAVPSAAPTGPAGPPLTDGEQRARHECEQCSTGFEVVYYSLAGERQEMCPVACPECWHVNHVPIAAGAGLNGDYRAQATA